VLVDNGSSDGTIEAVCSAFPDVQTIDAGENLGACGRNLGLEQVSTPYVALCDDDTWWDPGDLRRAADLLEAHPRLAIITARVVIGPNNLEDPICQQLLNSPLPRSADMPGPSLLGFLAGACVIRRRAFEEVGGFPRRAFIGGEEQLVAADLVTRGWWLCYRHNLTVHHYPSEQRDSRIRRICVVRNAIWFAWLRRPWASAFAKTISEARGALGDSPGRRGLVIALIGLPGILRRRRVVPAHVEQWFQLLDHPSAPPAAKKEHPSCSVIKI